MLLWSVFKPETQLVNFVDYLKAKFKLNTTLNTKFIGKDEQKKSEGQRQSQSPKSWVIVTPRPFNEGEDNNNIFVNPKKRESFFFIIHINPAFLVKGEEMIGLLLLLLL